jgi:CDGSH-type Zn-finger protein
MAEVNITPSENGPYLVFRAVCLTDVVGRDIPHGDHMALCRCGHSKNKPFCDGMHVRVGFDGTLKN